MLREAQGGVLASIIAAFGAVISEVRAVMLVGGNIDSQTRVLTAAIALALALGAVLLGLALLANMLLLRLGRRPRW